MKVFPKKKKQDIYCVMIVNLCLRYFQGSPDLFVWINDHCQEQKIILSFRNLLIIWMIVFFHIKCWNATEEYIYRIVSLSSYFHITQKIQESDVLGKAIQRMFKCRQYSEGSKEIWYSETHVPGFKELVSPGIMARPCI